MTFTYDLANPTDITRVRFHIGDTISELRIFEDDEIQFVIDEEGSWKKAVIACLQNIILKISSEPDFTADWLQVQYGRSLEGYKAVLAQKKISFGTATAVAIAHHVYRADSDATEAPDYD